MTAESTIEQQLHDAIAGAIEGAEVTVHAAQGGHYELQVISESFEGQRTLERHRRVLGAIKELMAGDAAPVHAIDRIDARTP